MGSDASRLQGGGLMALTGGFLGLVHSASMVWVGSGAAAIYQLVKYFHE